MKKYGYRNLSDRNEIEKSSAVQGKYEYNNRTNQFLTKYDFIDWAEQTNQASTTKYHIKSLEQLLKASDLVSK